MNEVTQRRLIGLAVILAALFILSLLLPQGARRSPGEAPVAEVRVDEAARYDPSAAPPPPASTSADSAQMADAGFKPEPSPVQPLPPPPPPPVATPTEPEPQAESGPEPRTEAKADPKTLALQAPTLPKTDKAPAKPVEPKPVDKPVDKPAEKPADKTPTPAVAVKAEPARNFVPVEKPATPIARPNEAKPAVEAKPAEPAKPAGGAHWYVQIGSYAGEGNAQTTASLLRNAGYTSEVGPIQTGKGTLYRVRVGPYASAEAADAALTKLRSQGYPNAQKRGD